MRRYFSMCACVIQSLSLERESLQNNVIIAFLHIHWYENNAVKISVEHNQKKNF